MDFNFLNNNLVTTLIGGILGAIVGGFVTFKFNYFHEKRKLIMEQKLKVWEVISVYFEDMFNIFHEIDTEYFECILEENNQAISLFISKAPQIQENIRRIDSKINNYYFLFEKVNYLYDIKMQLFNLVSCIDSEIDLTNFEFQQQILSLETEIKNAHQILNFELVKILDDSYAKKKRIKNFKNETKIK